MWFKSETSGQWLSSSRMTNVDGSLSVAIQPGPWQQGATQVLYYLEMTTDDGVARSGSKSSPHRLTLQ